MSCLFVTDLSLYVKESEYFFGFDFLPIISYIVGHVFLMSCLYLKKQLL